MAGLLPAARTATICRMLQIGDRQGSSGGIVGHVSNLVTQMDSRNKSCGLFVARITELFVGVQLDRLGGSCAHRSWEASVAQLRL